MQLVRGKDIENYLQNSRVDTTVDRVRSKSKEDKNFAPKQNERDCPMTRKSKLKLRLLKLLRMTSKVSGVFFGTTIYDHNYMTTT